MALRPFLLVGVGGSGGKTLRYIKKALQNTLTDVKYEGPLPKGWQFLHFDTPQTQDGANFPRPMLDPTEYVSTVPSGATYEGVDLNLRQLTPAPHVLDIIRPLPEPSQVPIDLSIGAGQYRGVGKAVALSNLERIYQAAQDAYNIIKDGSVQSELDQIEKNIGAVARDQTALPDPVVVFISSIGGGTGSGQFMEIVECVKAAVGNTNNVSFRTMSILYAPDTFSGISAPQTKNIPANSLLSLTEIMNGIWSQQASEPLQALYKRARVIPNPSASARQGAAYNWVIGRYSTNGGDLGGQDKTYMAAGEFLRALIANPFFQTDFFAYPIANWAQYAKPAEDASGIHLQKETPTPFRSFGFGKVSLGLEDGFREFASQRLAKSTVNAILLKHMSLDPNGDERNSTEWITYFADQAKPAFFEASGLAYPRDNQAAYQIISSINPDTQDQIATLLGERMRADYSGSHHLADWAKFIENEFQTLRPVAIREYKSQLNAQIRLWVTKIQGTLLEEVQRSIGDHGLPVTCELLRRLQNELDSLKGTFRDKAVKARADAASVAQALMTALSGNSRSKPMPATQGVVKQAIEIAERHLPFEMYAELWDAGAKLTQDITENFILRLRQSLEEAEATLTFGINRKALPDGRPNPWNDWKDFDQPFTPQQFAPAANVAQLISHTQYPAEFDRLLAASFAANTNAKLAAVTEITLGSDSVAMTSAIKGQEWETLGLTTLWTPLEPEFQPVRQVPSPAQFKVLGSHMEYLDACEKWLELPGRPFYTFIHQSLAAYLQAGNDSELRQKREIDFVAAFKTALNKSNPLVQIDSTVHTLIHGKSFHVEPVVSSIPVDKESPLGQQLVSIFQAQFPGNPYELKFTGSEGPGSEVFFAPYIADPFSPIAMTSIMQPIAERWLSQQTTPAGRIGFLEFKRGRPLADSLPIPKKIRRWMIQGWYIAKLLNLIDIKRSSDPMGHPEIRIWHSSNLEYVSFPSPMMVEGQPSKVDYLAAILISLEAAFIEVFNQKSLLPMEPYKKLRRLAEHSGLDNWESYELWRWIDDGELLEPGQPSPDEKIAGLAVETRSQRLSSFVASVRRELAEFNQTMSNLDPNADPRTYPDIWELRFEINEALTNLITRLSGGADPTEIYSDNEEGNGSRFASGQGS